MRLTLTAAAFALAAFHPFTLRAQSGAAGASDDVPGAAGFNDTAGEAGAPPAEGGRAGSGGATSSAGKGGGGGSAPVPAPNLPDPGTDQGDSCSMAGPNAPWNLIGTSLVLSAACFTWRRRRLR